MMLLAQNLFQTNIKGARAALGDQNNDAIKAESKLNVLRHLARL